ncbi:sporulation regulator-like protein [Halodesulfurarchaeum formicicum]|uniref:Sporulation regulator-like protein n=1 Tax=Halodesulfurarchaeum formicicum TaxID=1873524 RepID=A0A1D8S3I4_9EURY|nr:GNAT family N-acetyltransferase [Halodesulfurarchaeum formicicum]AOW79905.1 sporulation regulator-like protein [Halodesulfurarchaeum formicicum]
MRVSVTPAESDALDAVLECWIDLVEGQRAYGSHIEGETNREAARDLLGQYIAGEMLAVARPADESADEIIGFVMFYRDRGLFEESVPRGVIENVYVVPSARGNGVGSALMDYAETELADRGVEVVGLSAMAENRTAREWYRSRGYEEHRVVMERQLEDF